MLSTRAVLVGLVLMTIIAIVTMSFKSREHFEPNEAGSDASDAMVFRVYMDIYGVPPPPHVTETYAAMVGESGLDEEALKSLIEADLDAAPGAELIEEGFEDEEGFEHALRGWDRLGTISTRFPEEVVPGESPTASDVISYV